MDREAALRAAYDALNRRDFATLLELFDPKVEFVNPDDALEPDTRHVTSS
jgi:ketosteroid isomerase-like protein